MSHPVRHDTGNILNTPRYRLIRFAGKHISLSLWYCTTHNANSCHNRCGAHLVRVICPPPPDPPCVPQQSGPVGTLPYSLSSEMSEVISFSSVSVWPNNLRTGLPPIQYSYRLFFMQDSLQVLVPWVVRTKCTFEKINISAKLQCAEFQSYLRYFERMIVEIVYVSAESL